METSYAACDGLTPEVWLRRHVGKGSEVFGGSKRRFCHCVPKSQIPEVGSVVTWGGVSLSLMDLRGEGSVQSLRAVLFLFLLRVTRTRQWMYFVATARCLGKRCDCRGCYGTDGWSVDDANFHHMEAFRAN